MRPALSGALDRNRGLISSAAQTRLADSSVLVAGVGGIGGRAAETLARLGVGRLVLADPDTYTESNLNRQAGASVHTLGLNKSTVIQQVCTEIGTGAHVETLTEGITAANIPGALAGVDLVIDAIDYTAPHVAVAIARSARALRIPVITAVELGYSVWHTTYTAGSQSYEQFFGLSESTDLVDLEAGRVSVAFWRLIGRLPRYVDLATVRSVERGDLAVPAIAPAVELAAALLATNAVAILTTGAPVVAAPKVCHVDLLRGKAKIYRPRFATFCLSVATAFLADRLCVASPRRARNET